MVPSVITFEVAKAIIGTLPSLAPRPNPSNISLLTEHFEQGLQTIPSTQALEYGYLGTVMPEQIYALRTQTPWANRQDPEAHPAAANTAADQNNIRAIYNADKSVFDSNQDIWRADSTEALNAAVPRKSAGNQIGIKIYTICNNPRDILDNQTIHGTSTNPSKHYSIDLENVTFFLSWQNHCLLWIKSLTKQIPQYSARGCTK